MSSVRAPVQKILLTLAWRVDCKVRNRQRVNEILVTKSDIKQKKPQFFPFLKRNNLRKMELFVFQLG